MTPLVGRDGKVPREWQGANVTIRARIGRVGSRVTTLIVADEFVIVPNSELDSLIVTARKVRTPAQVSAAAKRGAQTKAATMTKERLREIAQKAANARWRKVK